MHTDSAGVFADGRTVAERLVDAGDAVVGHGEEVARGQLGAGRTGVKECRCCVRHTLRGEEVVRLEGHVEVVIPDAEGHTHPHMLRAFHDFHRSIPEKVGLLEGLESEVVEEVVPVVLDTGVDDVGVCIGDIVQFLGNVGNG